MVDELFIWLTCCPMSTSSCSIDCLFAAFTSEWMFYPIFLLYLIVPFSLFIFLAIYICFTHYCKGTFLWLKIYTKVESLKIYQYLLIYFGIYFILHQCQLTLQKIFLLLKILLTRFNALIANNYLENNILEGIKRKLMPIKKG